MKETVEFIMTGASVSRYHTVDLIKSETVGHHSHGVAMLCLVIDPDVSSNVLKAALVHDLAEQYTGDIPSPAKRALHMGVEIENLETTLLNQHGIPIPKLTYGEKVVLKLADNLHGALKCVREIKMGNTLLIPVLNRYISYAESLPLGVLDSRAKELIEVVKEMSK